MAKKRYALYGSNKIEIEIEHKTPDKIFQLSNGDYEFVYGYNTVSEHREWRAKEDIEVIEK